MSVFSLIKRSRQQAKDHKEKQAEKAKEAPKQAYRHIPTHAAVDALSGAPAGYRHEDRSRILEENRRRSAMVASGLTNRMPGPSLPRVSSSLSHVTYPAAHANPVGNMPRAYSYSGVPHLAPWEQRNIKNPSMYSVPDTTRISLKGKEVDRSYASGRNSPSSIKAGSPVGSSSQSTSSQEDLEIKPSRHVSMPPTSSEPSRNPAVAIHTHRLHPSSRRASDASDKGDTSPKASPTDRSRPPPSMRGFNSIPAMPSLPPMQLGSPLTNQPPAQPVFSSSASTRSSTHGSMSSFNFNVNNTPFSAPISGRSSAATTPAACVTPEPVYESVEEEEESSSYTYAPAPAASAAAPSALKQKDRRSTSKSKVTRFTELETIDSHTEQPTIRSIPYEQSRQSTPPQLSNDAINKAIAVEMISAAPAEVVSAPKSGKRLSKQPGSKLTKKSRWSTKSSAVAV
ncbi:hypothetical protein CkaCkLH20_01042 [Colletotrichum karsti]|uniref:Uncharacterized protein n=1 Tax=Colletotrichum karsti TaxID=1095194 RepID=A0A9P6LQN8_9PEZI|nr:uncharacterized protein CkaCkLH20_01042 [Colletotrichum karsti]KAF9881896.1 hypothetical protein CkaCkLH20_01042 [Colletotrichum karsti]